MALRHDVLLPQLAQRVLFEPLLQPFGILSRKCRAPVLAVDHDHVVRSNSSRNVGDCVATITWQCSDAAFNRAAMTTTARGMQTEFRFVDHDQRRQVFLRLKRSVISAIARKAPSGSWCGPKTYRNSRLANSTATSVSFGFSGSSTKSPNHGAICRIVSTIRRYDGTSLRCLKLAIQHGREVAAVATASSGCRPCSIGRRMRGRRWRYR